MQTTKKVLAGILTLVFLLSFDLASASNVFAAQSTEPETTNEVRIDFQTKGSRTAEGYLPDNGDEYGDRGNGFTYGWTPGNIGNARDYGLLEPDTKLATINQFGAGVIWEIAVPNGKYEVTVGIGDALYPDQIKGKLILLAEDTVLFENRQVGGEWEHVKPDGQTYVSKTATVDVKDGRLTLDSQDSAKKNIKINYIDIKSLDIPIPVNPIDPGEDEPIPEIDRTPVTIIVHGKEAGSDIPPVRADGQVMVPVSIIEKGLGADVVWNEERNAVLIHSMPGQARLRQKLIQLIVNGLEINPKVRPFVLDGNIMLPMREISEAMGLDVSWKEAARTLDIRLRPHTKPSMELYGWAAADAEELKGTTGGGDAKPQTVTTREELEQLAGDDVPRVLVISGTITSGIAPISIGSNKTITGENQYATIRGGIAIDECSNIVLRNLNIQGIWPIYGPADTISVRYSHHLWLDHLSIWDASDGLLDLTQGTNYVTVSWNKFFYTDSDNPHRLVSLNGGGAEHEETDTGRNKVTYHHNWFANRTDQRMPRVLFGQAHAYNNYYTSADNTYAIGVGVFASMLVENNYFRGVNNPHQFMYPDRRPACITARGNIYDNTSGSRDTGTVTPDGYDPVAPFTNPPYSYEPDDAQDIPFLVTRYAGPTITAEGGSDLPETVPGKPVLSHSNGWDTGIPDGDYTVTMDLWYGVNGTSYKLYENGKQIDAMKLKDKSPAHQTAKSNVRGRAEGTYTYYCELTNAVGTTKSDPITVKVTQTKPGTPNLSGNNYQNKSSYRITMNMWWGINGTTYKLYENDELIDTQTLTAKTPDVQTVYTDVRDKPAGTYTYHCELINDFGSTKSKAITVEVKE